MKKLMILLFLASIFGCNPIQEINEGREAAQRAQKEAKLVLEKIKEHSDKAEAAAQRAESAAASSENSSRKAEAASQKVVESFQKRLKK